MKINDLDERNPGAADDQGDALDFSSATFADASVRQARADMLELGLAHHEAGRMAQAQAMYLRILSMQPNDADALHLLGVAEHQAGNHVVALDCIGRAISLDPLVARYHNNLASVYQALGRFDEAGRCASASLALKPDSAEAHYNLGVIFSDCGAQDKAEACFRQALSLQPAFAQAHFNLGILLRRACHFSEAARCFEQAVRHDPGNDTARFLLAACSGEGLERAPDRYIAETFDADAGKFDERLVADLQYDTPQRLSQICGGLLRDAKGTMDVLDLGCGTGLAGVHFSAYARHLAGVDLSAGMLARARLRQLYQRLEQGELLSMMQGENTARYDLIVSADVFIYIGKLDAIFTEAKRLLRAGGLFVFSVESLDSLPQAEPKPTGGCSYRLNTSGRFAHSAAYIHELACACGFRINTMLSARARLEAGKPVSAWLVLLESDEDS